MRVQTIFLGLVYLVSASHSLSTKFFSRSSDNIPGGAETAEPGEFPWSVAVMRGGYFMCSGSLLAPDRVLTVGHCCEG